MHSPNKERQGLVVCVPLEPTNDDRRVFKAAYRSRQTLVQGRWSLVVGTTVGTCRWSLVAVHATALNPNKEAFLHCLVGSQAGVRTRRRERPPVSTHYTSRRTVHKREDEPNQMPCVLVIFNRLNRKCGRGARTDVRNIIEPSSPRITPITKSATNKKKVQVHGKLTLSTVSVGS
jgi:hypothetical protein